MELQTHTSYTITMTDKEIRELTLAIGDLSLTLANLNLEHRPQLPDELVGLWDLLHKGLGWE